LYCSQESVNKIDIYKSGVVRFEKSWWAWQLLGAAYLKEGNFGNAIEIYSRALAENPDAEWARDGSHEAQRIKNMQANLAGKLSTIAD
jgi:tetratricopeptide (TPR) repeat protein